MSKKKIVHNVNHKWIDQSMSTSFPQHSNDVLEELSFYKRKSDLCKSKIKVNASLENGMWNTRFII